MLHEINPYVHSFKAALESIPQGQTDDYKFVISADKRPTAGHPGRYNTPVANEVLSSCFGGLRMRATRHRVALSR